MTRTRYDVLAAFGFHDAGADSLTRRDTVCEKLAEHVAALEGAVASVRSIKTPIYERVEENNTLCVDWEAGHSHALHEVRRALEGIA